MQHVATREVTTVY